MTERFTTDNPELDALFERYRQAPKSHVFAPLADACRKAGLIDEAVDIADLGVNENPGYTSGHVVRGKCYYDRGDRKIAVGCFERVLDLDPNNLVALKFLGLIQAEEGDATGARERFKHILALDPDDREIRNELDILDVPQAEAPSPQEAPAAAVTEAPSATVDDGFEGAPISLGTDDDPTTDELATTTLADIYAEQGYTDKALRIYHEVLKRQPGNAGVRARIQAIEGPDAGAAEEEPDDPVLTIEPERFAEVPAMEAEAPEEAEAPQPEPSVQTVVDDPTFPPPPGVAIELPPPDDLELEAPEVPETDAPDGVSEPAFEEFAPTVDAAPAVEPAPVDDDDPNNPLPYQRRDGTIDEGRSYEQFKRWLKNLAD